MTYLPLLLASAVLLLVVVLMAGDLERGWRVVRNIILAIVVLTVLALLFALAARQLIPD